MLLGNARNLFFESGSSIAYLAVEVNEKLQEVHETLDLRTISVETNNIFACLEFALKSPIQVSLYPSGPPEQKYGATFGPLKGMLEYELPENLDWEVHLDRSVETRLEPVKQHFADRYKENGVIFMTASGVEFSMMVFEAHTSGALATCCLNVSYSALGAPRLWFSTKQRYHRRSCSAVAILFAMGT